jgi:hypothetical protein
MMLFEGCRYEEENGLRGRVKLLRASNFRKQPLFPLTLSRANHFFKPRGGAQL